jgi:serine/threonine protein kinase
MRSIDTVFDIDFSTEIKVLDGERSSRFLINDSKNQQMTLQCSDYNEMMRWVLSLRSVTFQHKSLSMANFKVLAVLGRGNYGKVMLCEEFETGDYYAIKSVRKATLVEANRVKTVLSERNILAKIVHPFIVSMKFAFQTPSKFYFGLEYVPGGELFYHMQRRGVIPINEVRLYAAEVSLALHHLHQAKIIYRDLKPENVLLDREGHVKLTDFGLSKDLSNSPTGASTFCGTTEYLAPEIVMRQPYGPPVDWWALGVLIYEMLFGTTPFANENRPKMYRDICKGEAKFPEDAPKDAVDLIKQLLVKDPKGRGGFALLKTHEFYRSLTADRVLRKLIPPAFVPEVRNLGVPENFDREFTDEAPADSFVMPVRGPLIRVSRFSFSFRHVEDGEPAEDIDISNDGKYVVVEAAPEPLVRESEPTVN